MAIRFVVDRGERRTTFERARMHTAEWDRQKAGFRLRLGMPPVGNK